MKIEDIQEVLGIGKIMQKIQQEEMMKKEIRDLLNYYIKECMEITQD